MRLIRSELNGDGHLALIAALVADHGIIRSAVHIDLLLPAIVLAGTFAQLRRTFGQPTGTASAVLQPDCRKHRLALAIGARSTYLLA